MALGNYEPIEVTEYTEEELIQCLRYYQETGLLAKSKSCIVLKHNLGYKIVETNPVTSIVINVPGRISDYDKTYRRFIDVCMYVLRASPCLVSFGRNVTKH